jgi:hypothetical protein
MEYPMFIRYKDDNTLTLVMVNGDIQAGRAFTIIAQRLRIIRRKR